MVSKNFDLQAFQAEVEMELRNLVPRDPFEVLQLALLVLQL
jgi:hypothetical protein